VICPDCEREIEPHASHFCAPICVCDHRLGDHNAMGHGRCTKCDCAKYQARPVRTVEAEEEPK
jgi:hypothetical protein